MLSNPLVILSAVFLGTFLLLDFLFRLLRRQRTRKRQATNRLQALREKVGPQDAHKALLRRRGFGTDNEEQTIGGFISLMIAQAELEISLFRRVLYLAVLTVIGMVFGAAFLGLSQISAIIFGPVFAVAAAAFIVYFLRARRIKKFTYQLPQAIDIIVRSLNAGHPLPTSIAMCAREMPDPIGSEFGILSDQITFGSELDQALVNMADRVGAPEVNLLGVTINVQRGTGGNLSEILENLSQMIRDRLMIKAKIKAISAEGRFTSWIMLAFPFVLFYMIRALVPTYFDIVWESGYGTAITLGCLTAIGMGMIVVRRLVNFDF